MRRVGKVKVFFDVLDENIARAYSEISEEALRMAYQPIDFPGQDVDPSTQILCTDIELRIKIIYSRRRLAEQISGQITDILMRAFESKDTIMGYPIERED